MFDKEYLAKYFVGVFAFFSIIFLFLSGVIIGYHFAEPVNEIEEQDNPRFTVFNLTGYHFVYLNLIDDITMSYNEYFLVNINNLTRSRTYLLETYSDEYFLTPPYLWVENDTLWGHDDFYLSGECICWYLFLLFEINNTLTENLAQNMNLIDYLLINSTNL